MTRSGLEPGTRPLLLVALCALALATTALAGSAEDDLQAVKRAVLATDSSQARPPAADPRPPRTEAAPRSGHGEPIWFRVRLVEKTGKRARVSVDLPIGLVRTPADGWPLPSLHGCRKRERCGATFGEILRALDGGQSLVEIEADDASVRVWVD
jgi:hypothetical protein